MNNATELLRLALALGPRFQATHHSADEPPEQVLQRILNSGKTCQAWGQSPCIAAVLQEMRRLTRKLDDLGGRLIFPFDAEYPADLAKRTRPPGVLFVVGHIPRCAWIAIVGSRAASMKNVKIAQALAAGLGHAGWGVVSGGALGIDGAAHQGALTAGSPTVAVLGSGLDHLYPPRHAGLFEQIKGCGALISPFPPGAPPRRGHFLQRNHLIAAMARAVVVVEAQHRSGALNTAKRAREMRIPVMALDSSPGARRLFQSGAVRVQTAQNILNVIEGGGGAVCTSAPENLDQCAALELLRAGDLSIDEAARQLKWRVARTAAAMLQLEMAGLVHVTPGGRFSAVPGPASS